MNLLTSMPTKGHGSRPGEQQDKGSDREPLQCWICVKDHRKNDCPLYQGGISQIYSAQEVQTVGDVGQSIPWIYAAFDNKQADHQTSIIDMEGKLCD